MLLNIISNILFQFRSIDNLNISCKPHDKTAYTCIAAHFGFQQPFVFTDLGEVFLG